MTSLNKKANNYSSILGDIKAAVLLEKNKGRNIKMMMKRLPTNSLDKSDLVGLKSIQGGSSGMNAMNMNTVYLNNKHGISNDGISKCGGIDKRMMDKRLIVGNDYGKKIPPEYNYGNVSTNNPPNKIDIKISVNYGKSSGTVAPTPGSCNGNLTSSHSKSFYYSNDKLIETKVTSPNSTQFENNIGELHAKDTNIKTHPISTDNKLLTSLNSEDKMFKKKIIESKEHSISNANSFCSNSNAHKRNISDTNYFQNNLSISLMNYNNKSQISNYMNSTAEKKQNNSFQYNTQLFNHFKNSGINEESSVILDTAKKNDPVQILNNNELTFNRNDNEFFQIVNDKITSTGISSPSANLIPSPGISSSSSNKNQVMILTAQLMEMLKGVENNDKLKEKDKNEAIGKKFAIYKKVIDELVKVAYSEEKEILTKIRNGIDEVVNDLMTRNMKMNERLGESEGIVTSNITSSNIICIDYKIVSKKYAELYKAYQEKTAENKILKGRIAIFEKERQMMKSNQETEKEKTASAVNTITTIEQPGNSNNSIINVSSSLALNTLSVNPEPTKENITIEQSSNQNLRSRIPTMINQNQVLDDLDALYFFDKIDMRAHSVSHTKIPKLDLNFSQNKPQKQQQEAANPANMVINIGHDIPNGMMNKSSNNNFSKFHNPNGRNLSYSNSHLNTMTTNLSVKKAAMK